MASPAERLEREAAEFRKLEEQLQKINGQRQQLLTQMNENEMVKKELTTLDADSEVFRLVGPMLIKQDVDESRKHVDNRLKYITDEMKRLEVLFKETQEKLQKKQAVVMELQQRLAQDAPQLVPGQ